SPSLSLAEVAAAHNTSTEALALWMTIPAIREQLESTDAISTWRTRLIAKSLLPKAVGACADILDDFHRRRPSRGMGLPAHVSAASAEVPLPITPDSLRAEIVRVGASESLRRCASLIFQISRVQE